MVGSERFRPELWRQALRYGLAGAALAALYSAVYWTLAARYGVAAQTANALAFAVNLGVGWLLHSRWSFRGYGLPGREHVAVAGFLAVNFIGYGFNCLWVWLVVDLARQPVAVSVLPIVIVTPAINFMLNRLLIFRVRL